MRTTLNSSALRPLCLLAIALLSLLLSGCPGEVGFDGRIVIINSTGGALRSIVITEGQESERKRTIPDLIHGQAWVEDCHQKSMTGWPLTVSYINQEGIPLTQTVPFLTGIPTPCHDDFYIEIRSNKIDSGLLGYNQYHRRNIGLIVSHILAVAAGLSMGCLLWRRNQRQVVLPKVNPEVG